MKSATKNLSGGPGSSVTRQCRQWLACQTVAEGPFERERVSRQMSKLEGYVCWETLSPISSKRVPDEMRNLALEPEKNRATILRMNGLLNELMAKEVGANDGHFLPQDIRPK